MQERLRQLTDKLDQVAQAPSQLGDTVDRLKASPGGRKLTELDAKAGRLYARVIAAAWFLAGVAALTLGYVGGLLTEGWTRHAIYFAAAVVFLGALWGGISRLRNARAASELLVEELEDRVKPAKWTLQAIRSVSGRTGHSAD